MTISLEFCKSSDSRYQEIRDRHYVPNKGTHGQQIHFLIHYKGEIVGIISGASSVYTTQPRDEYFKIPKDKELKQNVYLPAIVNNVVFRLEYHEKNLATKVLAKWRRVMIELWAYLYGVDVIGFETFVIESDIRKGTLYKADNWDYVGLTAGNTKAHGKGGVYTKPTRLQTEQKLIFCKLVSKKIPVKKYISSWKASTPEEKLRAKQLNFKRQELIGKRF